MTMMKKTTLALLALTVLAFGCSKSGQSGKTDADSTMAETAAHDNEAIQAVAAAYVDAKLAAADSMYVIGDKSGAYDYMHDGVREMDGWFVSCIDVLVGDDVYDVDLYVMMHDDGSYMVGREVLHTINGEESGMVLWEAEMMDSDSL